MNWPRQDYAAESILDRTPEELARVREVLKEGVTEVRRFMFDLRPATLHAYGLTATVQQYVEDYARFFGRRAAFTLNGTMPPLTPDQELTIFRIIQETLQNAHKHAGNDASIEVELSVNNETVSVRVSDDGVGFDPALVAPKLTSGHGMLGMRERASTARARLTIESKLGGGSVITLILPIDPQSDLGLAWSQ